MIVNKSNFRVSGPQGIAVDAGLRVFILAGVALGPLVLANSPSAAAQDEGEEIVVTALKRQSTVQAIPASISAISGEALERQGISDVRDLSKVVPNLIWGEHFGTSLVTIRGVGSNVDSGATEPTIAMYVDGVYLPRSDMATLRAVDLERVEVLRGPQGTLYGRNTTGGAINFISAAPTKTFEGKVEVSGGSRNGYGVNGFVSGPINQVVSFRLSGGYEKQDGYVKVLNTGQTLNGADDVFGRLAIRIEPTSNLRIDLSARYDRNTAPVAYQQYLAPSVLGASATWTDKPNRIIADYPFGGKNQTLVLGSTINWEISDHLTLRSVTGYVDHKSHARVDDDNSIGLFIEHTDDFRRPSRSFTQEFTLLGESERLKWIVGLYYFHENYIGVLPVTVNSGTISLGQSAKINTAAAYGDLTYSITPKFRVNLGLRYNREENRYGEDWSFLPFTNSAVLKANSDKLLPKVALQYDIATDVQSYVQWTRGHKSGGVNFPDGSGAILPLYQPEKVDAYEAGVKSQFFNRRVTANVAIFYDDYRNLQITAVAPPVGTAVQNADAKIFGIEGDFRVKATDKLTLSFAPTWESPVFHNYIALDPIFGNAVDMKGRLLPRAPRFTFNAGAEQRIDLGDGWLSTLYLQGNVLYSTDVVLRYYNQSPEDVQDAYVVANLSVSLTDASEKTRFTFFANNLSDTLYRQNVTNFGLGYMGNYGPPTTWGVRVSRSF